MNNFDITEYLGLFLTITKIFIFITLLWGIYTAWEFIKELKEYKYYEEEETDEEDEF